MIVGLQDRVDEFMRVFTYDETGQWYFQPRDFDTRLAVTEDQVNEAEERFRVRFKIATFFTWTLTLATMGWIYVRIISDDWPFIAFLGMVPLTLATSIFYVWAGASSTRRLRRQLRDAEAQHRIAMAEHGSSHRIILPNWKRMRGQAIITSVIVAAFAGYTGWQYFINRHLLDEGTLVHAKVTRSDANNPRRTCVVEYAYEWQGKSFAGELNKCNLMDAHPVGSALPVMIDPEHPDRSLEPHQSPWPGSVIALFILVPLLLLSLATL